MISGAAGAVSLSSGVTALQLEGEKLRSEGELLVYQHVSLFKNSSKFS